MAREARAMSKADVKVLIAHMELTTGGSLGPKRAIQQTRGNQADPTEGPYFRKTICHRCSH